MRLTIEKSYTYFCCSTLPLLNGDIKIIIDENTLEIIGARIKYTPMKMKDLLELILEHLKREYSKFGSIEFIYLRLKREHRRMVKLYEFRLSELEYWK